MCVPNVDKVHPRMNGMISLNITRVSVRSMFGDSAPPDRNNYKLSHNSVSATMGGKFAHSKMDCNLSGSTGLSAVDESIEEKTRE